MIAVHFSLGKQRERHVVVRRAERTDIFGCARLLTSEFVAREAQNDQSPVAIFSIYLLKLLVLGCVATFGRNIDDEHRLFPKISEANRVSVERDKGDFGQRHELNRRLAERRPEDTP